MSSPNDNSQQRLHGTQIPMEDWQRSTGPELSNTYGLPPVFFSQEAGPSLQTIYESYENPSNERNSSGSSSSPSSSISSMTTTVNKPKEEDDDQYARAEDIYEPEQPKSSSSFRPQLTIAVPQGKGQDKPAMRGAGLSEKKDSPKKEETADKGITTSLPIEVPRPISPATQHLQQIQQAMIDANLLHPLYKTDNRPLPNTTVSCGSTAPRYTSVPASVKPHFELNYHRFVNETGTDARMNQLIRQCQDTPELYRGLIINQQMRNTREQLDEHIKEAEEIKRDLGQTILTLTDMETRHKELCDHLHEFAEDISQTAVKVVRDDIPVELFRQR